MSTAPAHICPTCNEPRAPYTNSGACRVCFQSWLCRVTPMPKPRDTERTFEDREDEHETLYGCVGGAYENAVRAMEECDA